eukprot:7924872-Karenia_brevis.AAC.1
MDPIFEKTAGSLGRLWKRSKRILPKQLASAYVELLRAIHPHFVLLKKLQPFDILLRDVPASVDLQIT